ncbi:MAG TPA: modification methylase, partial [Clostridiales bacterium]|nr:modification methylase [Clostridiales bacterium]
MAKSDALRTARKAKNDEFYTQLEDIEKELCHYKAHFKGKTVFCNCDDPFESNFFKYFAMNFNFLGLKKLIATCYDNSPIAFTQLDLFGKNKDLKNNSRRAYKIEITEVTDENGDGATDLADVKYLLQNKENALSLLKGNGDFRSEECVELLKQSDIVVTNPPFSLFREYVGQLIEYNKKFIIIGNKNAIAYKEIFPLIKDNKIWLGYRNINQDMWLIVPENAEYEKIIDGNKVKHIMACWFTNLETTKRHEVMPLYKKYSPEEYPTYDNFNAINVTTTVDIPFDYDGIMGVPITFMEKYNPEQFE